MYNRTTLVCTCNMHINTQHSIPDIDVQLNIDYINLYYYNRIYNTL